MRTTVTLPDSLFEEAEILAHRQGKTRSQLYAEAVRNYVARHDEAEVTRQLDRILDGLGDVDDPAREDERAVTRTAEDLPRRVEW